VIEIIAKVSAPGFQMQDPAAWIFTRPSPDDSAERDCAMDLRSLVAESWIILLNAMFSVS